MQVPYLGEGGCESMSLATLHTSWSLKMSHYDNLRLPVLRLLACVGRMWLTLEDAEEFERLDRCLRMIWEIEIEWLMV